MSDLNREPSGERDKFAQMLRNLAPSGGKLRRERVVFEAGRMKGQRQARFWVGMTAMLACLAVCLAFWIIITTPDQYPHVRVRQFAEPTATPALIPVVVPVPYRLEPSEKPELEQIAQQMDDDRLKRAWEIRRQMLEKGIDELPELPSSPNLPKAVANDLRDILPDEGPPRPQVPGSIYLLPR